MCTGLVEIKVCMRGRAAWRTASAQRSISPGVERAKPQITADELKILKWWVEIGAPETEKLNEVEASEEILQSIKASLSDEFSQ